MESGFVRRVTAFMKKEAVLVAASILAIVSAFFVTPSADYIGYIDFRVLGILLSLMTVMAGLRGTGFFDRLGTRLLASTHSTFQLICSLVFLCFFTSMLITNDVALITFVPFAIMTLQKSKQEALMIPVVVLQTLAANLGSMLTPIGNPQNLYLYNLMGLSIPAFVRIMLPATATAGVMLLISVLVISRREAGKDCEATSGVRESDCDVTTNQAFAGAQRADEGSEVLDSATHTHEVASQLDAAGAVTQGSTSSSRETTIKNVAYLVLFALSLLVVMRVLPYYVVLAIVLVTVFVMDRQVLASVDYFLLLTFIAFFIFTGNMGQLTGIRDLLQSLVAGHEIGIGIAASQVISNVPATLLLSSFTTQYDKLLLGVNLGGLGTLIASMASLISYKAYAQAYNETKGKYFFWFTATNVLYLIVLVGVTVVLM